MVAVIFYIMALASIAGAIGVVTAPNPIHSAMFLVLTLMSFAVHYVLLGADLAAAVQVIVYASAVVILFLFVIMLLGVDKRETQEEPLVGQRVIAAFVSITFALTLLFIGGAKWASGLNSQTGSLKASNNNGLGNIEIVSQQLFTKYVFVFELTGVLLVGAVIGAVVLARRSQSGLFLDERSEAGATLPTTNDVSSKRGEAGSILPTTNDSEVLDAN